MLSILPSFSLRIFSMYSSETTNSGTREYPHPPRGR